MFGGTLARRTTVRSGLYPGSVVALDFCRQQYRVRGVTYNDILKVPGASFTRASVAYADDRVGIWRLFDSGRPAITDRGYLAAESRQNLCLWCRDWTNAAWTASNCTTAKNALGIDATASGATTLTATGANATVLQSFTHASGNRGFYVWIRRVTGSGNIDLTVDNGSTWTTVTVTSTWAQYKITQAAVTNGIAGIRIVSSGDAIEVDFASYLFNFVLSSTSAFPTPIATTTVAITSAADVLKLNQTTPGAFVNPLNECTVFLEHHCRTTQPTIGSHFSLLRGSDTAHLLRLRTTSATQLGVTFANVADSSEWNIAAAIADTGDVIVRKALRIRDNDGAFYNNGVSALTDTSMTASTGLLDSLWVGIPPSSTDPLLHHIRRLVVYPFPLRNEQMIALTKAVPTELQ